MPTLHESLDALDSMVTNHASTPEIRSQIAHIAREVAALEADYMRAVDSQTKLAPAQLQRDEDTAEQNRHRVGVTLKHGKTVYYDADTHAILPSKLDPQVVEFRKTDKAKHTYTVAASARWSEVAEIHNPKKAQQGRCTE